MTTTHTELPQIEEARTERINLRSTPTEAALIRQAAAARRMSVTDFMLQASLAEAGRAINEERRLSVMNEVFDRLSAEVDEPEHIVEALAEMIKKPRTLNIFE